MTHERRRASFVCALVALIPCSGVSAQVVRLGAEFQLNTFTLNRQWLPSVATDADGDFVVVWESLAQDNQSYGVFARRFSSAGTSLGGEFQVNTHTLDIQNRASAMAEADGDFVVAWQSRNQEGTGYGIFARRFSSAGVSLATEFQVNTFTPNQQNLPSLGLEADGDFVVAWQSVQDFSGFGVFARRFSSAGAALAGEFQVNIYTSNDQFRPAIGVDSDGDFVIAWESRGQDGGNSAVFARRFSSAGTALGGEFQINTFTSFYQERPAIGIDPGGDFVVAWSSANQDAPSGYGIFARRFSSAGTALASEFQVNTFTLYSQRYASVAADADGDFVVAWASVNQDGSSYGIFGRRFSSAGTALGGEFHVNTFTTSYQRVPRVAAEAGGDFVVAWSSSQDGDSEGVFAQRFALFATLDVDADGALGALTDGLLVLRWLFGFTGTTLTTGAVGGACERCDAATILPYLTGLGSILDIDDDGALTPLTDGLLVLRWLFGFTGATLINSAVGGGCERCDAPAIETYLAGLDA
jgi:hypothetical protein